MSPRPHPTLAGLLALVALLAGCRGLADLEDAEEGATALSADLVPLRVGWLRAQGAARRGEPHRGSVAADPGSDPRRGRRVEDQRFYHHHGVDLKALAPSRVRRREAGEIVEGGSTITQQS